MPADLPKGGAVLVKLPGTDAFIPLEDVEQLPTGTTFDLRDGKIKLVSSAKGSKTRSTDFYGGEVKVTQGSKDGAYTVAKLVGPLEGCGGKQRKGEEYLAPGPKKLKR